MSKPNTLFKKILHNNFWIVSVCLFLILLMIFTYVCKSDIKSRDDAVRALADSEAFRLKTEIYAEIDRLDFISGNTDIFEKLNIAYTEYYDKYELSCYLNQFFGVISSDNVKIKIFTENNSVFESKYILLSDRLENYGDIKSKVKGSKDVVIFDGYHNDEDGDYFLMYNKMSLSENSILQLKLYINVNKDLKIEMIPKNDVSEFDAPISKIYYNYYCVPKYENNNMEIFLQYMIIFLLTFVIIMIFVYIIMKKHVKFLISNIDDFVKQLDSSQIIKDDFILKENDNDFHEIIKIKQILQFFFDELNASIKARYDQDMMNQKLKNDLLRSQLNPHTLYNSLSAIKFYAFKRNDHFIMDLVDDMVDYYHMVLHKDKSISTIREERDLIRAYLKICEKSYDKKIDFICNIKHSDLNIKIPHQFLIPFIENSVEHGFSAASDECRIDLNIKNTDGNIFITIEDNGYGIPPNKLKCFDDMDSYALGYGIRNSYMRGKMEYGCNFSIKVTSEYEHNTKVNITIPVGNNENQIF